MALKNATLRDAVRQIKARVPLLFVFSLFINLLVLSVPIYMMQIFDRALSSGRIETLVLLTLVAAVAALAFGLLDTARTRLMARISGWLERKLAPELIGATFKDALDQRRSGAQSLRDIATVRSFVGSSGFITLLDAPWVPVFLVVIWIMHPLLGLVGIGGAILLFTAAVLNEYVSRKPLGEAERITLSNQQQISAAVYGAEAIEAMGMRPSILARWIGRNEEAASLQSQASDGSALLVGLTKFVRMLVQILILGIGGYLVLRADLTAGGMIAASILLGRALAPVEQSISIWRNLVTARGAWARVLETLNRHPNRDEKIHLPVPAGRLACERVALRRAGREEPILQDISFAIAEGEMLGIIGPSASGKSSLCKLLVGVWQPTRGYVRLDGADIFRWPSEQLGPYIGYVPQATDLYSGSVTTNIARLSPCPDAKAVLEAAMAAGVHEMILRLPDGYETDIGPGGVFLSGGQRQRIALARALYNKPRLIVLDEPNANLDSEGELSLLRALERAKEWGATVVVVAHQPYMLRSADKLLYLADGRMRAFGTRDEVLSLAKGITPRPSRQRTIASGAAPGALPNATINEGAK